MLQICYCLATVPQSIHFVPQNHRRILLFEKPHNVSNVVGSLFCAFINSFHKLFIGGGRWFKKRV